MPVSAAEEGLVMMSAQMESESISDRLLLCSRMLLLTFV